MAAEEAKRDKQEGLEECGLFVVVYVEIAARLFGLVRIVFSFGGFVLKRFQS